MNRLSAPVATSSLLVADAECRQIQDLISGSKAPLFALAAQAQGSVLGQISEGLRQQREAGHPIRTLHLIAHGRPGAFRIGESWIDAEALKAHATDLAHWGLETIALWSCHVGADADFVALLAELSGAQVLASADWLGRDEEGHEQLQLGGWSLAEVTNAAAWPASFRLGHRGHAKSVPDGLDPEGVRIALEGGKHWGATDQARYDAWAAQQQSSVQAALGGEAGVEASGSNELSIRTWSFATDSPTDGDGNGQGCATSALNFKVEGINSGSTYAFAVDSGGLGLPTTTKVYLSSTGKEPWSEIDLDQYQTLKPNDDGEVFLKVEDSTGALDGFASTLTATVREKGPVIDGDGNINIDYRQMVLKGAVLLDGDGSKNGLQNTDSGEGEYKYENIFQPLKDDAGLTLRANVKYEFSKIASFIFDEDSKDVYGSSPNRFQPRIQERQRTTSTSANQQETIDGHIDYTWKFHLDPPKDLAGKQDYYKKLWKNLQLPQDYIRELLEGKPVQVSLENFWLNAIDMDSHHQRNTRFAEYIQIPSVNVDSIANSDTNKEADVLYSLPIAGSHLSPGAPIQNGEKGPNQYKSPDENKPYTLVNVQQGDESNGFTEVPDGWTRFLGATHFAAFNTQQRNSATDLSNVPSASVLLDYRNPVKELNFRAGISGQINPKDYSKWHKRFFSISLGDSITAPGGYDPNGSGSADSATYDLGWCGVVSKVKGEALCLDDNKADTASFFYTVTVEPELNVGDEYYYQFAGDFFADEGRYELTAYVDGQNIFDDANGMEGLAAYYAGSFTLLDRSGEEGDDNNTFLVQVDLKSNDVLSGDEELLLAIDGTDLPRFGEEKTVDDDPEGANSTYINGHLDTKKVRDYIGQVGEDEGNKGAAVELAPDFDCEIDGLVQSVKAVGACVEKAQVDKAWFAYEVDLKGGYNQQDVSQTYFYKFESNKSLEEGYQVLGVYVDGVLVPAVEKEGAFEVPTTGVSSNFTVMVAVKAPEVLDGTEALRLSLTNVPPRTQKPRRWKGATADISNFENCEIEDLVTKVTADGACIDNQQADTAIFSFTVGLKGGYNQQLMEQLYYYKFDSNKSLGDGYQVLEVFVDGLAIDVPDKYGTFALETVEIARSFKVDVVVKADDVLDGSESLTLTVDNDSKAMDEGDGISATAVIENFDDCGFEGSVQSIDAIGACVDDGNANKASFGFDVELGPGYNQSDYTYSYRFDATKTLADGYEVTAFYVNDELQNNFGKEGSFSIPSNDFYASSKIKVKVDVQAVGQLDGSEALTLTMDNTSSPAELDGNSPSETAVINNFEDCPPPLGDVSDVNLYLVMDNSTSMLLPDPSTKNADQRDRLESQDRVALYSFHQALAKGGYGFRRQGERDVLSSSEFRDVLINTSSNDLSSALDRFEVVVNPRFEGQAQTVTVDLITYGYAVDHGRLTLGPDNLGEAMNAVQTILDVKTPDQVYGNSIDGNTLWSERGLPAVTGYDTFWGEGRPASNLYSGTEMLGALEGLEHLLAAQLNRGAADPITTYISMTTDGRPERRPWWDTRKGSGSDSLTGQDVRLPVALGRDAITTSGLIYSNDGKALFLNNNEGEQQWSAMQNRLNATLDAIAAQQSHPDYRLQVSVLGMGDGSDANFPAIYSDLFGLRTFNNSKGGWSYDYFTSYALPDFVG